MSKEKQHIDQSSREQLMHDQKSLIEQCAASDRHAQKKLYDLYSGRMFVICLRYCKSQLEAEDVLQEAFIKVFKNIKNFRGDSRLEFWIKRIVINTALNHQRSKLYQFPMYDVEEMHQLQNSENVLSDFHLEELLEMVQSLPEGCRLVFNLYAIEGYNHKEIGEILKISEGTSKSQFSRARKLLQEKILKEKERSYENVK